jgi:chemotaxis protein methyltransferase CheR
MQTEEKLSPIILNSICRLIAERLGLHYPPERVEELEKTLRPLGAGLGYRTAQAFAGFLLDSPLDDSTIDLLAQTLSVNETYFFRERDVFNRLETDILPPLIAARRTTEKTLRIWSAACSTGEEAFSIAILLDRMLPDRSDWDITILATDLNPIALQHARRGVYRDWSFRRAPEWLKHRYFTPAENGAFEIAPAIKEMASFRRLNLAESQYPSWLNNTYAMDLIFCRNVLMYFTPEAMQTVVDKLRHCLAPGGWLIPGQTELSQTLFWGFRRIAFDDAVLYRRPAVPEEDSIIATAPAQSPFGSRLKPRSSRPARIRPGAVRSEAAAKQTISREAANDADAAELLYLQGKIAEAETAATRLLLEQTDETRARLYTLLARCAVKQGKWAEGKWWRRQAVLASPLDVRLHYLLALISIRNGNDREAAAALRSTLFLDPDFVMAHVTSGQIAERRGVREAAARHYANAKRLLSLRPPDELIAEADGMTARQLINMIEQSGIYADAG